MSFRVRIYNGKPHNTMKKYAVVQLITYVIMLTYGLIVVFPMVWALYSSFKTNREFFADPWALPRGFHFENYIYAWNRANLGKYFFNSVVVTGIAVVVLIILGSMLAYVVARTPNYKPSAAIGNLFMFGLLVPMVFGVLPTFLLLNRLNLLDTIRGITLVYIANGLAFTFFVLQSFFKTIPSVLEEAALIDGCSLNQAFWLIIFPLARPGIVTVSIFNFLSFWNEYILANTLISTDKVRTLPIGLAMLMTIAQRQTNWGAMFAGMIIITIPAIVIYSLFQKGLTRGITVGAVKM